MSSFPPLVFTGGVVPAYSGSFIHYTKEEIMDIVKGVRDLSIPSVPEGDHSLVVVVDSVLHCLVVFCSQRGSRVETTYDVHRPVAGGGSSSYLFCG